MKTLHLSIIGIFILLMPIVYQIPVYAPTAILNNSTGSYEECQKKIGDDMQMVVNSINKTKAILLAIRSNDFQSKVSGYKYVFSGIFTNMTENQKTCDDVKLTSIVTEFSILDNNSKFVKFVEVGEDTSLTLVTLVEDVFVQKCDNNCPPPGPPAADTTQDQQPLTPLRQIASGVAPKDVMCKSGFALVLKVEDQFPACVKPQTATKLIQSGWAVDDRVRTRSVEPFDTVRMNIYGTIFSFNYTISGGQLENATADVQNKSLIILIKTVENGTLIVDLPRTLIDPQINGQDSKFIIIEDGKEVEYSQPVTTDTNRVLSIPFQNGVSKIEIISPEPIR